MTNIALITGITGQDGSYLLELLLEKKYEVWGIIRRSSSYNTKRIDKYTLDKNINNKVLFIRYGDMTDTSCFVNILNEITNKYNKNINVLEIYNLAAQSHVKVSFEIPEYTANCDAFGTLRLLEVIRNNKYSNKIKFYQASTSEMYGKVQEIPQNENTPFYPRSPYGVAKLYSHWIVKNYRESYNLFCCSGILFNHESERRGETFVTRKITLALNNILKDDTHILVLGNINSKRDWGHAKDYVYGMWLMLQHETPDDYVLATNKYYTVREFVEEAFKIKGFNIKWKGHGLNEIGFDSNTGKELIFISNDYYRPCEVDELLGDASKAEKILNWKPKITFKKLIELMVKNDCD